MSQKIYLNILRGGIYLSLVVIFFVFKSFLFPFITSKQIPFNILMEILFIFWVAFIVKYPEYRPKKSYVSWGLIGFFTALVLSSVFGVDFNLSFWGDIERMLGVFHLLHFLIFYFIAITVFRDWKDWKLLFIISIIYSVFISFIGIFGASRYSTIGNTAYVSGYLIFNMYFALLLFFKEKSRFVRWFYLFPIPIMFLEFRVADTTGALVGLGFSIIVLFFLYGILSQDRKKKITTLSIFVLLVIMTSFLLLNKDKDFIINSPLGFVSSVSLQKVTFQTRLISWRAAFKDIKNHPVLGTGHGNYAIIFDKYFDPKFYDYTRSETYFDRAHNNVIDILSTSGIVGLVAYLSIFAAVAYYLILGYRKQKINIHEFVLLSCLITAYFVQNLAVFDSLVTYMCLMMTLGYVYWLSQDDAQKRAIMSSDRELDNKEIYSLLIVGIIILTITYQYNIRPWQMLVHTINGQRYASQNDLKNAIENYKKALSMNTVLDRDSRTSFIRLFDNPAVLNSVMSKEQAQEVLDYAISMAEANVKYNPNDSMNQMILAGILNNTAIFNSNPEKFAFYSKRALEAIDKSIAASPGRIPIYYQKAQIYISRGEKDKAIETLQYALTLNEKYFDSYFYLGRTLIYYKQEDEGYKYLGKTLDLDGMEMINSVGLAKNLIDYFAKKEDWLKVIKVYERMNNSIDPKNVTNWINLAKLYNQVGEKEKAKKAAEKVAELDPGMKQYVDGFIGELK